MSKEQFCQTGSGEGFGASEEIEACGIGVGVPAFARGVVSRCYAEENAVPRKSVWHVIVSLVPQGEKKPACPSAGQFYLLKAGTSSVLLGRPVSVYHFDFDAQSGELSLEFLILVKGKGTEELCALKAGDVIEMTGPLGKSWIQVAREAEEEDCAREARTEGAKSRGKKHGERGLKIALAGGGIGIAPVACLASALEPKSYDFYAAFKSGCYGLEYADPDELFVTTDDGSCGKKGMISAAFGKEEALKYDAIFACGPDPMLAYIQGVCAEAGTKCFLSTESRMACGVGACLGCVIQTKNGNKKVCKDGPIFSADVLDFQRKTGAGASENPSATLPLDCGAGAEDFAASASENLSSSSDSSSTREEKTDCGAKRKNPQTFCAQETRGAQKADRAGTRFEADLSVEISGVCLKNPVIAASGTFGYAREYESMVDVASLGAICSKGLTLRARNGNSGIRLYETASGLINSIGLENPGIEHFLRHELPAMSRFKVPVIANLSGSAIEDYVAGARLLENSCVAMIELNISCPNVSAGGMAFGMNCASAQSVTSAVKSVLTKPLIVKLTPNAPDLINIALSVIEAGADALSLVNTFQAIAIDIESGRPVFKNVRAGLSGPAIKPIALRMVYDTAQAVNSLCEAKRVPIIGLGGISTPKDAIEFIMAGASAIQTGTATFSNPLAMTQIIEGLRVFMNRKGFKCLNDFKGSAL